MVEERKAGHELAEKKTVRVYRGFKMREVQGEAIMQLNPEAKHLMDTNKMVAYRTETALVGLLGPDCSRSEEEGRALAQEVLRASADVLLDKADGLHELACVA